MKRQIYLIIVGVLISQTLAKYGPSFDCSKARTMTEKLICKNDSLSTLDMNLNQIYKIIQHKVNEEDKLKLKKEQLLWLKKRKIDKTQTEIFNVDKLTNLYNQRIDTLFSALYYLMKASNTNKFKETPFSKTIKTLLEKGNLKDSLRFKAYRSRINLPYDWKDKSKKFDFINKTYKGLLNTIIYSDKHTLENELLSWDNHHGFEMYEVDFNNDGFNDFLFKTTMGKVNREGVIFIVNNGKEFSYLKEISSKFSSSEDGPYNRRIYFEKFNNAFYLIEVDDDLVKVYSLNQKKIDYEFGYHIKQREYSENVKYSEDIKLSEDNIILNLLKEKVINIANEIGTNSRSYILVGDEVEVKDKKRFKFLGNDFIRVFEIDIDNDGNNEVMTKDKWGHLMSFNYSFHLYKDNSYHKATKNDFHFVSFFKDRKWKSMQNKDNIIFLSLDSKNYLVKIKSRSNFNLDEYYDFDCFEINKQETINHGTIKVSIKIIPEINPISENFSGRKEPHFGGAENIIRRLSNILDVSDFSSDKKEEIIEYLKDQTEEIILNE